MLLVATPLLLLIFFLCVYFLLVWLVCVLVCFSWVYSVWDSLCLLDFIDYFLFHVVEIFNYNLFKNFLIHFLFLFFCDPYNLNVGAFDMVPEVSEMVLSSFHSFLLYSALQKLFLSSSSLICSFASDILLLIPSGVFLI